MRNDPVRAGDLQLGESSSRQQPCRKQSSPRATSCEVDGGICTNGSPIFKSNLFRPNNLQAACRIEKLLNLRGIPKISPPAGIISGLPYQGSEPGLGPGRVALLVPPVVYVGCWASPR